MPSSDIIITNPCAVTPGQTENPGCQFFPCLVSTHLRLLHKPVNLAPFVLERTLLAAENAKFSAYLHTPLSCSYIDCEPQGTGG